MLLNTLPTLSKLIIEAYTPKPEVQHLNQVGDFKRFCMDGDGAQSRVLAPLNNISFNHDFLIKKSSMSHNTTLFYAKQYSSSSKWEPQEGCRLFLCFLDAEIHGAEQMLYGDHNLNWLSMFDWWAKDILDVMPWRETEKYWAHQEVCWCLECWMVGNFFTISIRF